MHKRRGIAGGLFVFKCAAAAAERGDDLDAVAAVAARANDRTRSFGVAFSGARCPARPSRCSRCPRGGWRSGMGIHGEPGFEETDVPTADGLAELLVDALLAERPVDGERAVVLLNGLGSVKYEELFVLYGNVAEAARPTPASTIVEPEVGEMVTSFDMAGVSLTLAWLDDELEQLWAAPGGHACVPEGRASIASRQRSRTTPTSSRPRPSRPAGSTESQAVASRIVDALEAVAAALDAHADELGRIDAVAGDGDHGIGMQRGLGRRGDRRAPGWPEPAPARRCGSPATPGRTGRRHLRRALGHRAAGARRRDRRRDRARRRDHRRRASPTAGTGSCSSARPKVGDKTMVDVLVPVVEAAQAGSLAELAGVAEQAAAASTADLVPKIGRARPHAEKSIGTPDAGAVSLALVIKTVMKVHGCSEQAVADRRRRG